MENLRGEDIETSKKGIIDGIKTIDDEQAMQIVYLFGQEFENKKTNIEEYIEKITKVTKEEVVKIAKKVEIDTIYFLKN